LLKEKVANFLKHGVVYMLSLIHVCTSSLVCLSQIHIIYWQIYCQCCDVDWPWLLEQCFNTMLMCDVVIQALELRQHKQD